MQEDINKINNCLNLALITAQQLQAKVMEEEGDSELYRKISSYLVPNLRHWINGAQVGNIKDLNELIERNAKK